MRNAERQSITNNLGMEFNPITSGHVVQQLNCNNMSLASLTKEQKKPEYKIRMEQRELGVT